MPSAEPDVDPEYSHVGFLCAKGINVPPPPSEYNLVNGLESSLLLAFSVIQCPGDNHPCNIGSCSFNGENEPVAIEPE